jgi:hypothetical protein
MLLLALAPCSISLLLCWVGLGGWCCFGFGFGVFFAFSRFVSFVFSLFS